MRPLAKMTWNSKKGLILSNSQPGSPVPWQEPIPLLAVFWRICWQRWGQEWNLWHFRILIIPRSSVIWNLGFWNSLGHYVSHYECVRWCSWVCYCKSVRWCQAMTVLNGRLTGSTVRRSIRLNDTIGKMRCSEGSIYWARARYRPVAGLLSWLVPDNRPPCLPRHVHIHILLIIPGPWEVPGTWESLAPGSQVTKARPCWRPWGP